MKQFAYLDTDTVDSIMAQHGNGIVLEKEQKRGEGENHDIKDANQTYISIL